MLTIAAVLFRSKGLPLRQPGTAFAPMRSPFDMASLAVVVGLSVLFAATIACAMHPAPLVDPAQAVLQGGL